MWRISSAAFAASRSAIRRLISAAEKAAVPAPAAGVVLRSDDMAFLHLSRQLPSRARAWRAIIRFSSVFITYAAARLTDAGLMLRVGRLVELEPEPAARPADGTSHRCGIFADAGGEDDTVEAPERRRERADLASRAIVK